jgi:aspartate carbamoyltransferase catalytic subunit
LKYGRTVHSLIGAMSRYDNVRFVLISPDELKIPSYIKDGFLKDNYVETKSLEDAIPDLDILYMTRIQGERFDDREEYERLKDSYVLTKEKLRFAKPDLSIMHPLPRVTEISTDVDGDPRAHYFEQARLGRYIRMALILKLLSENDGNINMLPGEALSSRACKNPKCISAFERGIAHIVKNGKCIYCDSEI